MRRNKFGNVKTTNDHGTFDSKAEAKDAVELFLLEKAGKIRNVERQVRIDLFAFETYKTTGKKVCTYVADFVYVDLETNRVVIRDTKGVRTALFNLKWKILKANFGDAYIYELSTREGVKRE